MKLQTGVAHDNRFDHELSHLQNSAVTQAANIWRW